MGSWFFRVSLIVCVLAVIASYVSYKYNMNQMEAKHKQELIELEKKYTNIISRIEERNRDVISVHKAREENLVKLNSQKEKLLNDISREDVIRKKPKLVEPKLNSSFRGVIDDIVKETTHNSN